MHIYVCYKSKVMYSQLLREEGGVHFTCNVMKDNIIGAVYKRC